MTKFEVYEDNAGGLSLFVFSREGLRVWTGLEHAPGQLATCIKDLKRGASIQDWDQDEDVLDAQKFYDEVSNEDDLIMDQDGVYIDNMGTSGELEVLQQSQELERWDLGEESLSVEELCNGSRWVEWIWYDGSEKIIEHIPLELAEEAFQDFERQDLIEIIKEYNSREA